MRRIKFRKYQADVKLIKEKEDTFIVEKLGKDHKLEANPSSYIKNETANNRLNKKLFGLTPFSINGNNFQKSKLWILWNITLLLVLLGSLITVQDDPDNDSFIIQVIGWLDKYISHLCIICGIFLQCVYVDSILNVMDDINTFDSYAEEILRVDVKKEYKRGRIFVIVVLISTTLYITISIFITIAILGEGIDTAIGSFFLLASPTIINTYVILQFFIIIYNLKNRFLWLNNIFTTNIRSIESSLKIDIQRPSSYTVTTGLIQDRLIHLIATIRMKHFELCQIFHKMNRAFQIQVVAIILQSFITITLCIIYGGLHIIIRHLFEVAYIIYLVVQLSLSVMQIMCLVLICSATSEEAAKVGSLIHKLLSAIRKEVKFHLKKELFLEVVFFSIQLLHQNVKFRACNLFSLNESLLFAVSKLVINYNSKIFGLTPFSINSSEYKRSILNIMLCFLLFIIYLTLFIIFNEKQAINTGFITTLTSELDFYCNQFSMLSGVILAIHYAKDSITGDINQFDVELQHLFKISLNDEYRKNTIVIYSAVGFTLCLLIYNSVSVLFMEFVVDIKKLRGIADFIIYMGPIMANTVITLQFTSIVWCLKRRFLLLNNIVSNVYNKINSYKTCIFLQTNVKSSDFLQDRVINIFESTREMHNKLCNISITINKCYSFQLLLLVLQSYLTVILATYSGGRNLFGKKPVSIKYLIYSGNQMFLAVLHITALVLTCSHTTREARKTGDLVHDTLSSLEPCRTDTYIQVSYFSLQMLHNNFVFTAFGIFTMDYSLLLEIIGGICTYMVIVVQFEIAYGKK
ncbi:hypothetical protein FQA39_LY17160 [Lamprigera yunnana]|nr:hypothetical protein FQA39_LY17160 [Lamprigera yunnana]